MQAHPEHVCGSPVDVHIERRAVVVDPIKWQHAHTKQAADHMGALAARVYARQLVQRGISSRISTGSASVLRNVRKPPLAGSRSSTELDLHELRSADCCREVIAHVEKDSVAGIRFADEGAVPLGLLAKAENAAFLHVLFAAPVLDSGVPPHSTLSTDTRTASVASPAYFKCEYVVSAS